MLCMRFITDFVAFAVSPSALVRHDAQIRRPDAKPTGQDMPVHLKSPARFHMPETRTGHSVFL